MGNLFLYEKQLWDNEVDSEAANLVKKGMPPYAALEKATAIVSRRRRKQNTDDTEKEEGRSEELLNDH